MRSLPVQDQLLTGTIEYEFDVASLLNVGDAIANAAWVMPAELTLVSSMVDGTKVRGFIKASGTAKLYEKYPVSFVVNTVGNPTPVSPSLSFEIKMVNRISVIVM